MSTAARHPLVEDYLQQLWTEAARLPVDQARELTADIEEHLRAALPHEATETQVRNVLERLGRPANLVSEAGGVTTPTPAYAPVTVAARPFASPWAAIACLVGGELLFITGYVGLLVWLAGMVLMARATVWSPAEKVLGFAALGTGLPVAYASLYLIFFNSPGCVMTLAGGGGFCEGPSTPLLVFAAAYVAVQAFVVWRLVASARRA